MEPDTEATVLRLLEDALALPEAERGAWLATLNAAPAVVARLRELLADADVATAFLTTPAPMPETWTGLRSPVPGDRLGAWQLERELGSGGMGVVFLAVRSDGTFEQRAALKLMRGEFLLLDAADRATLAARFDNERRVLARLQHPNVARIIDGGSTPAGVPWLVMEYIDGVPLTQYCDRERLDVAARTALFCKLCDGVQAAHQRLIVHRDIKPHNVLVGADGDPKLLDFGIARALDVDASVNTTRAGLQAATPAYASPEQLRGQPVTTTSDVYSLGVVLYELLTGNRPYTLDGISAAEGERIVCQTQPPTLRRALTSSDLPLPERQARSARIDADLERIVAKAMHKDPDRRYGSAQALADDLRRHLEGRPVLAHPDSVGYRARKFVQRHRFGTAAATSAVLAILVTAGVALWQARSARLAAADTGQINAFLTDVLNLTSPYATGTEVSLSDALDEAVKMLDQRFAGRPDLAVDVHNAVAQSMYSRGRLNAAEQQAILARNGGARLFGADDRRTITAIAILANVRKEQGRDDEAKTLFADALQRVRRGAEAGGPLEASLINDLGVLYLLEGDYAQARATLQRALALDAADDETRAEHARTLANLAQAETGLGHLDRAETLYAEAQPVLEGLYPDGGPNLAVLLNNRAKLARLRGDMPAALALQQRAVAMHRHAFKGDHAMVLVPLTNLARLALDLERIDLAAPAAEQAAAMAERLYPDGQRASFVNALAALAAVRLAQHRDADARPLLGRAQKALARLDAAPAATRKYVAELVTRACPRDPTACAASE